MKGIIGFLLCCIGFLLIFGGIIYAAYLLHPVFGAVVGGGFLFLIGMTILEEL